MRQVFEFIHFGWLNEKKRYWSVSPSPPLPSLSKYLPRAGSKRAYIHFANRNYLFSVIVPLVQGKILWTRHDGNREKRRTNTDSGIKRLKWTISFYDDVYIVFQFFFFFFFLFSAKRYRHISRVKNGSYKHTIRGIVRILITVRKKNALCMTRYGWHFFGSKEKRMLRWKISFDENVRNAFNHALQCS